MDARVNPPNGIHPDIPFADYLRLPRVSAHGLMQIERSPAHYRHAIDTPREPTPAQALGTLSHLAILEPDRFDSEVFVAPEVNKRTKAGKAELEAWQASLPDDAVIADPDHHALACAMRESVMAQPYARALLEDGSAEQTMLATDHETGIDLKARADWLPSGHAAIVDLKTAQDASETAFARAAGNFKYHIQAAFYTDIAKAVELGDCAFVFIAVETAPPHAVALYQLDDEAMHSGRIRYQRALDRYRDSRDSGQWPGYAQEIQPLTLPKWSL